MASKKNEAKVIFTAETADMQKEIKKADSVLRELRSELKLNNEEMKTTGESAQGLSKQQEILRKEADQYEAKIEALNAKLKAANEIFGEQSEEASRIRTTINNTSSAYEKIKQSINETEQAIKAQNDAMGEAQAETKTTETAYERLTGTIEKQRNELDRLETEYKNAVLQYGKNSTEAKQLKGQMQSLSGELEDNERAMDQLEKTAKKAAGRMDDLGDAAGDTKEGFTVAKGAMATFAGNAMTGMIGAAKNGLTTLYNLADETREYRNEMSKLSSAAQSNGYSVDFAKDKYLDMYAVLADETAANTTVSNFMAMKMSQDDLNTVLNAATGIWAKYGDSIPLDGLAESINETANTATVTGNLADALNWAGISEDDFNEKLSKCKTTQERQNLIVKTLDKTYGKLGTSYKQNNKSVMDANRATAEYNDTMAELGAEMEPITTSVKKGFTEVVKAAMGLVDADVDKAAEKIGDAFEWVAENIETIVDVAKVGGTAIAGIFVVNKAANFISSIKTVTSTMGLFRTATVAATAATTAQTAAQTGLNAAMLANPVGLAVAGGAALAAVIAGLVIQHKKEQEALEKEIEQTWGLTEAQEELNSALSERSKSIEEAESKRQETITGIEQEYGYYQKLANELDTLVDANGRVKKGNEERATVITQILSEALGIEIDLTNGVIQNYQKLKTGIDEVIQKKKAEAVIDAAKEDYAEAIKNQADAYQELIQAQEGQEQSLQKLNDAYDKLHDAQKRYEEFEGDMTQKSMLKQKVDEAKMAVDTAREAYGESQEAVNKAQANYDKYGALIANQENLMAAAATGSAEDIELAMLKVKNSFVTAETGTRESLQNQVTNLRQSYDLMKQAAADGSLNVSQETLAAMAQMVTDAEAELAKLPPKAGSTMDGMTKEMANALLSGEPSIIAAASDLKGGTVNVLNDPEAFKKVGTNNMGSKDSGGMIGGMWSQKASSDKTSKEIAESSAKNLNASKTAENEGKKNVQASEKGANAEKKYSDSTYKKISDSAVTQLGKGNFAGSAKKGMGDYTRAVGQVNVKTPASKKAREAKSGLDSVKTSSSGKNFALGFTNGFGGVDVWGLAWSLGKKALSGLRSALGIHSPSRETYEDGYNFDAGFANSINDHVSLAENASKGLARAAMEPLNSLDGSNINLGIQEDYHRTLETTFNSRLESELLNLQTTLEAIKNIQFVLNINGQTFATATVGDYDRVNGNNMALKNRGVVT